jgi:hypothetical protein
MATLTARYTPAQREAVASAYLGTFASAREVGVRAAAGLLEHPNGGLLGPFDVPPNTVRSIARRARMREDAARSALRLADAEPRDAIERMRIQLADVIEAEFDRLETKQAEGRAVGGEALRQLARAIREFSSIPGPCDPQPRPPGAKLNGVRDGSETRGGLAGQILAAARRNQWPV